jgi:hypothetical protein
VTQAQKIKNKQQKPPIPFFQKHLYFMLAPKLELDAVVA